ncbi:MAG: hypothetical protein RLZZ473_1607, partial [Pseudomonadota bacterium]
MTGSPHALLGLRALLTIGVLASAALQAAPATVPVSLSAGASFKECAECPTMVVV